MTDEAEVPLVQDFLVQGSRVALSSAGALDPQDAELLEALLRFFDADRADLATLRRVLTDNPQLARTVRGDPRLREVLAAHLGAVPTIDRVVDGVPTQLLDAAIDASRPGTNPNAPDEPDEEVKIRHWRLECLHHAHRSKRRGLGEQSINRQLIDEGTSLQVVPDHPADPIKDVVRVHWRDDYIGALPPNLTVRGGGETQEIPQSGSEGGYTTYDLDAVWTDEWEESPPPFWKPAFWTGFNKRTSYTIAPGPASIKVETFHPYNWKLELNLPPWATLKDGHKWEPQQGGETIRALANPRTLEHEVESEGTLWKPSSLEIAKTDNAGKVTREHKLDAVKLSRNGTALELDAVELIGKVLEFSEQWRKLMSALKKFKDYAPEMGYYLDIDLQLLQGGLACEWYWKEHHDHRVFQYFDVNAQLQIFSLTFEAGVGVGAFGFKLQIFASVGGELALSGGMKRDDPDAGLSVQLPVITGKIVGALGSRAEAGSFFKFLAKGETAVEFEVAVGFNQRNKPVTFDAKLRWTGISCTATASGGLWGIGGTKTWRSTLVAPSGWRGLELPADTPYRPPTMSRAAMKARIQSTITAGFNVRVIRVVPGMFNDESWTPAQIADRIAQKMADDPLFDRSPETVEAVAHAVREDLDSLGERFGRDYIEESVFVAYVDRAHGGKSLQRHLQNAQSPERLMMAATGG